MSHTWLHCGQTCTFEQFKQGIESRKTLHKSRHEQDKEKKLAFFNVKKNKKKTRSRGSSVQYWVAGDEYGEEGYDSEFVKVIRLKLKPYDLSQYSLMSFFTTYQPHEILERLTIKLNELCQTYEIS